MLGSSVGPTVNAAVANILHSRARSPSDPLDRRTFLVFLSHQIRKRSEREKVRALLEEQVKEVRSAARNALHEAFNVEDAHSDTVLARTVLLARKKRLKNSRRTLRQQVREGGVAFFWGRWRVGVSLDKEVGREVLDVDLWGVFLSSFSMTPPHPPAPLCCCMPICYSSQLAENGYQASRMQLKLTLARDASSKRAARLAKEKGVLEQLRQQHTRLHIAVTHELDKLAQMKQLVARARLKRVGKLALLGAKLRSGFKKTADATGAKRSVGKGSAPAACPAAPAPAPAACPAPAAAPTVSDSRPPASLLFPKLSAHHVLSPPRPAVAGAGKGEGGECTPRLLKAASVDLGSEEASK
jgi:hypothetical protein